MEAVELGVNVESAVARAVDEWLARLAVVDGLLLLVSVCVICPVPDTVTLVVTVVLTERVVEGVLVMVLDVDWVAVGVRPLVTVPVDDLVLVGKPDPVRVILGVWVLVIVTEDVSVFNPVIVVVRLGVAVRELVGEIVCVGKGLAVWDGLAVESGDGVKEEVIV